jgi:hypothetical protein
VKPRKEPRKGRAFPQLPGTPPKSGLGKALAYAYLLDVMQRMPLMTTDQISSLIPERWVRQASDLAPV